MVSLANSDLKAREGERQGIKVLLFVVVVVVSLGLPVGKATDAVAFLEGQRTRSWPIGMEGAEGINT